MSEVFCTHGGLPVVWNAELEVKRSGNRTHAWMLWVGSRSDGKRIIQSKIYIGQKAWKAFAAEPGILEALTAEVKSHFSAHWDDAFDELVGELYSKWAWEQERAKPK